MPDIPDAAVQVAAERMLRRHEPEHSAAHLTWRDFAGDARAALDAAAPLLRREFAAHILMLDELERGYRCPACHERAASSGDDGSAVCGCGHRWVKPPWPDRSRLMLAVLEAAAAGEPVPGLPPKGGTRA